ncbi:MAG: shikimate dehydrogenase [Sphingomonadaceae bacterium]|nr:shikimate dehydrogenase [Sphingomonadaceae bacterium]
MTRLYAEVIGDPIAHSKSPLIHNFWLAKLGIDAEYRACHVRPDELEDYFTRRRGDTEWRGCNVTMPHKQAVLDFVDARGWSVGKLDAANCVVRTGTGLEAHNTDGAGVCDGLSRVSSDLWSVCLIGAGGAAVAAREELDAICGDDLRLVARDKAKAERFIDEFSFESRWFAFDEVANAMRDANGVINASPLGMTGRPAMPEPVLDALALTSAESFVFDMVYAPLETDLLKRAKALKRQRVDGLVMLVGQAAAAFEMFFGQPAPREHDGKLRALLTA